jgi:hypothetical protein
MRCAVVSRQLAILGLVCGLACGDRSMRTDRQGAAAQPSAGPRTHLQIDGTSFRTSQGAPFQWRGLTAFRLLDYVADRNEAEAEKLLGWAESRKLTVVRVLAMGGGFMDLKPADGRAALSRLLVLAAKHNLQVEVVALAGTMDMPVNLDEQLTTLGETLGEHPNALLEIANEPTHPSQAPAVGKPEVLFALAARVPADVPIALGSIEADESFARGDYATWHAPRDNKLDGWGHVLAIAQGAELVEKLKKPVVSDEPIGAGFKSQPGRRDDAPARFRAAALLTRLAGLGSTFHYEGGLQAKIPESRELDCFTAWDEAWSLLPADVESQGRFAASGTQGSTVQGFDRKAALGVFERIAADRGWVLAVGPGDPALKLAPGWKIAETKTFEGMRLVSVARQ